MAKIKALRTIAGTYGTLNVGKTTEVSDATANDLVKRNLVEIVGEKKAATKEETAATTRATKEEKAPKDTK